MKKEFYEKPIYSIASYIFAFLENSFYLIISNILLVTFLIITAKVPSSFNLLFLFIAMIPLGPSLGALYYSISKIIIEKDIFFSSYFWGFYKRNFISLLKTWLVELILIYIFIIDFQYFYFNNNNYIHWIFAVLIILSISITFYSFPINSIFTFSLKDTFLLSIYYTLKKFPITILKFVIILLVYFIMNNISLIFWPFIPSLIFILFFYFDKNVINEIKEKYTLTS